MRLPSLKALRAFEAVGRTGSIRTAGEELAVSPTVISRHIQNLESELGVELFEKQGRSLLLTTVGDAFFAQVRRAFDILRQANDDIRPTGERILNIWCIPGIASRRIIPKLPELQSQLNGCEIVLQPTLSRPDYSQSEADAEIVYLDSAEVGDELKGELLAHPRVLAVGSPAFCARFSVHGDAREFLQLPLIHEESTKQWERWLRLSGVDDVPILRGPRLWHAHLAIEAARLGQGVALANTLLVEEDLAAGRLIQIGASDVRLGGYYFIATARRWDDPPLIFLRQWLKDILRTGQKTDALNASVAVE